MKLTRTSVDLRSSHPPDVALAKLRACFALDQLPPLRLSSWQPFPRGVFLLGDFHGNAMTLRVVDATAPLRPVFQGELAECEGGSRLVGTIGYESSALAVVLLVVAHVAIFAGYVFWTITRSVPLTGLAVTCMLGFMVIRVKPALDAQENTFYKTIEGAGLTAS
jgi:hypothetical protein